MLSGMLTLPLPPLRSSPDESQLPACSCLIELRFAYLTAENTKPFHPRFFLLSSDYSYPFCDTEVLPIMATQAQEYPPEATAAKQSSVHPLSPLSSSEISFTAELIRAQWPPKVDLRFKIVTLEEPAKKSLVPYLEAEHSGKSLPRIERRAFVAYYLRNTVSPKFLPQCLLADNAPGQIP
jgi:Copper amine oxidase, N2 domain